MKFNQLRDVLAVAEFGSLRAASRALGIAQPGITRSVREIESELGVSLFERTAKGVRVTPVGAAFIRRADAVRAELRRAREEIAQLKGEETGEISVALSTAAMMAMLPNALGAFRRRYPEALVKIAEMLFHSVETSLIDGTTDFYVGPLEMASVSNALSVERLFTIRRYVIARRGHPLLGARSLSDLEPAFWVRPTLASTSGDADFDAIFTSRGLPRPKVVVNARSALVTLLTVANSDLLTILPQQWLELPATAGLSAAIELDQPLFAPPMCIVRRRELPLTPIAEHLCDLMRRTGENYARTHIASG